MQMERHDAIAYNFLAICGNSAMEFNRILRESGQNLSFDDQQALYHCYMRFATFWIRSGGNWTIKHNMMFHVVTRCALVGNPRFQWTYKDESLNGVVIKLAWNSHKLTFMDTVHNRFKWLGDLQLCTHMF